MTAVAGDADPGVINDHVGFFAPSSAYASNVGMENLSSNPDFAALRKAVAAAGYNGEKVVLLGAADVPRITAICQVGADVLSKIGLNVDYVSTDWGTVVQRMTRRQPIAEGDWSIFGSIWGGLDLDNPAGNAVLCGNNKDAWFGWPNLPKLEALRDQWLRATDMPAQRRWRRTCSTRRSRMHLGCRRRSDENRPGCQARRPMCGSWCSIRHASARSPALRRLFFAPALC